jgi:hypothetical protein
MRKTNPLYLLEEDWQIFQHILTKHRGAFYAYGSRVKGNHKKLSDIDLCVVGEVDLLQLKEDFYESNLPMRVDVKKIEDFSPSFL